MDDLKQNLMNFIKQKIQGFTQVDAAKILGVTQPRVSNLQNNKADLFSIDMLFGMIQKLGYVVESSPCVGGLSVKIHKIKVKKSISVIA